MLQTPFNPNKFKIFLDDSGLYCIHSCLICSCGKIKIYITRIYIYPGSLPGSLIWYWNVFIKYADIEHANGEIIQNTNKSEGDFEFKEGGI